MTLATFIPWLLTTGAITLGAWIWIAQYERIRKRHALEARDRAAELEAGRREVAELESRVEFAERLLRQEGQKPEERR